MSPEVHSQLTNIAAVSFVAVILIWLAYPAAVWALGRLIWRKPPTVVRKKPTVSIVIASRDNADAIHERVRDALRADYPADLLQVIVARDAAQQYGDQVHIPEVAGRVTVISGDAPGGKAYALNAAVRAASGDVLVFADTAQRFASTAISSLVEALADTRLGAVSGALSIGSDAHARSLAEWYWRFERWLRGAEARIHSTVGLTGAIYAMPRSLWRPLRSGVLCDDLYIPMELVLRGYRIGFCADAVAVDERRFAAPQEYARKVRTLTGVLQVCVWLPAVLLPIRNPIWPQFVCHKLLRLLTPYLVVVALAAAGAAAAFAAVEQSSTAGPILIAAALGVPLALWTLSRRARSAVAMGVAMQVAVVRATWHGLRGDWDVWRR
jgi:cellulose synthase/poly-beta-1,6-N-acetylglucosamine synthase-like glycosyltransferase